MGSSPAGMEDLAARGRSEFDAASRETVSGAALRVERALAAARLVFFGSILARFLAIGHTSCVQKVATIAPLAVGLLFSVLVLWRVRRPPRGEALWLVSVSFDALACFGALLPNALWPTPEYPGVLYQPDTAGMLVATAAAGLRLSTKAAVWAGLLNGASLLALVGVDAAVSGQRFATGIYPISMYLVWVLGSALVAVVLALTIRRLVLRSAEAATRQVRAEHGLWTVLAEHHDLRSMLTAAALRSEMLAEAYGASSDGTGAERLRRQAEELRDGLARIRALVEDIRGSALGNLARSRPAEPAGLAETVDRAVEQMRLRFPEVATRAEPMDPDLLVLVSGGPSSLERILLNLLQNACEADGRSGPTTVLVSAEADPGTRTARLIVRDDGPGLPDPPGRDARSTPPKPGGTGVGLTVVRGLVEGSGGTLTLSRGESRGTVATVTLPLARPT